MTALCTLCRYRHKTHTTPAVAIGAVDPNVDVGRSSGRSLGDAADRPNGHASQAPQPAQGIQGDLFEQGSFA